MQNKFSNCFAWERADLLTLVCYVFFFFFFFFVFFFFLVFITFPCDILGQVWYLIVSIPHLCRLSYIVWVIQEYEGHLL